MKPQMNSAETAIANTDKHWLLYILCILCIFTLNISSVNSYNLDVLSKDLHSPDESRALIALNELIEYQAHTQSLDGIKLLLSLSSYPSDKIRSAIEKSIPRLKITDEIIQWLKNDAAKSPNKDIRMLALRIVAAHSPLELISDFSGFVYDPDQNIRLENIKYLKGLSTSTVIPLLATALTDGFYPARETALEALAKYNSTPQAIEVIIKRYPLETSMTLQFEMEQILAKAYNISNNSYILLNYLTSDSPQVRALICRVIGKSTTINTIKALKEMKDNGNVEVAASRDWALKMLESNGQDSQPKSLPIPEGVKIIDALKSRFEPLKKEMLLKYNGDARTENAVRLGLGWLARNQEPDGSWNCAKNNPWHNKSPVPSFTNEDELVDVSVSALSLLCFLGEGSTHQSGLYQDNVRKGLEFIKSAQDQTGCVNIPKGHVHNKQCLEQGEDHGQLVRRYNHNISTLFLVELYAMTGDTQIKDMAQRALEHSKNKPEPGFPWSFYLEPTDMGPSIFYILALKIAQETDLLVSDKEIAQAKVYLDRLTNKPSGRIVHICPIPICFGGMDSTASGLFGHILMKSDKAIIAKGADWLKQFPPQWEPFYQYTDYYPNLLFLENNIMNEWHWYYQTLAFRQLGGDYWTEWNNKHKEVLLKHQRQGGLLDGSWDPEGPWATIGGRVYSTTFSIMSLQAYYSYSFTK